MAAPTTDEQRQTFLDALAKSGVIADACAAASVSRRQVYEWRKDEQFEHAYKEACEEAADGLESEARRRAVEGVTRKRYNKDGDIISEEMVYSDTLLLALLKARKPNDFAERSKTEISNPDGSLKPDSPVEAGARIAALLEEAKRRREAGVDPLFE
jgi:hypothetical protein